MPFYRLYSLLLESPRSLGHVAPVVPDSGDLPDIVLSFAQTGALLPVWTNASWTSIHEQTGLGWSLALSTAPAGSEAVLRLDTRRHDDEASVIFGRGAERIVVAWRSPRAETEQFWQELSGWLLGSVLGYAMCVRGVPTLHGSVVAVTGRAVGLLGVSGAGKSTLAAAFVAAGHAMLADDHLVVKQDVHGYAALPGPPRLRLWPTSLPVFEAGQPIPELWTDADGKHSVEATPAHCVAPLPLAAIYVLAPRDLARTSVTIEKLSPAAALNALMNQRFCMRPLWPSHPAETMMALAALAQQTPVYLLHRPHGLATLPGVVDAICRDLMPIGIESSV
ncbi:hypothetical protein [Candidatus Chloroploca sp. Khr17]|uniref:hypothetical protein n=1 Tax=Candidatus Chloroploca sp. Khr17 TaxID=2496869 RepID=UPI00101D35E5|nr:hypothetical protein [Candidatus Chloroploca sp. Khr17]